MKSFFLSILPALIFFIIVAIGATVYIAIQLNREVPQPSSAVEQQAEKPYLILGNGRISIDIADTEAARAQGLSGRDYLDPNSGVLFVFPSNYFWSIWMKDMKFPIDIVWVNDLGKIIHIEKNVGPDTYPAVFKPEDPARFVIELAAGRSDELGIKIGDFVENLPAMAK